MARGHCKVGDAAVDGPQSWSENTLLVLWEDSVALEVVLERWLGGQMAVEEVGRLRHAGGSCQNRNTPQRYIPWTLPAAAVLSGSLQRGFGVICADLRPLNP